MWSILEGKRPLCAQGRIEGRMCVSLAFGLLLAMLFNYSLQELKCLTCRHNVTCHICLSFGNCSGIWCGRPYLNCVTSHIIRCKGRTYLLTFHCTDIAYSLLPRVLSWFSNVRTCYS